MKRIVVKVGSAVLSEGETIAVERMRNLVNFIVELRQKCEVILVSSGAVSAGYTEFQLDKSVLSNKQALASIGQPLLMNNYRKKFGKHKVLISQILVTSSNFRTSKQSERAKDTIEVLIKNGVIPIVNENDATATEELELGDNDQLSAYVTEHFNADILLILSDIDAYYEHDPRTHSDAKIYKVVNRIKPSELKKTVTPNNEFATGGIVTKLKAASYLLKHKRKMFLASGFDLSDAYAYLIDGTHKGGTLFEN